MDKPKVSIVIPAHNEEASIGKTLEAVLNLAYPNFEVIVIDNNSTDKTGDVAGTYNVRVIKEPRKGTLFARECGRKNATGEIIANIDADCLPDPNWLSRGVEYFKSPKVVAVSGPYDYFDGPSWFRYLSLFVQDTLYVVANVFCRIFKLGGATLGGNCVFRASALEKMGGYNTAITFYGDDTDTAKRISKFGKVVFAPRMAMRSSARRFNNDSLFKVFGTYLFYFLKVTLGLNESKN